MEAAGHCTETVLEPLLCRAGSLLPSPEKKIRRYRDGPRERERFTEECKSIGSHHVSPLLRLARLEITPLAMRLC